MSEEVYINFNKSFGGVLTNSGEDERQSFIGNTWNWELGNGNWIFTPLASRSTHLRWWTPYHYSANNPVSSRDLNGKDTEYIQPEGLQEGEEQKIYTRRSGGRYAGYTLYTGTTGNVWHNGK